MTGISFGGYRDTRKGAEEIDNAMYRSMKDENVWELPRRTNIDSGQRIRVKRGHVMTLQRGADAWR